MQQYFSKSILLSFIVLLSMPVYGDDLTDTSNNGDTSNSAIQTQDQDEGGMNTTPSDPTDNTEIQTDTATMPPVTPTPSPSHTAQPSSTPTKELSPEEKAYQEKMMKISNAITQKIAEIQKKQSAIDSETFPAYVPPLQAEKNELTKQLHDLEMQRDQYQAQKTAQDLQKQLSKP